MIVPQVTPAQLAAAPNIFAVVGQLRQPVPSALGALIQQASAQALQTQAQALAHQIATLVGARPLPAASDSTTDHAWLVLLGHFAQHLGLIRALEQVPIPQRTRDHAPQAKLIQFLVGILAGLNYLQDVGDAPQPLVTDPAVIASWQQPAFAHYSGVSRTLAAADAATLDAVMAVLQQVSQPFLERELHTLIQQGHPLVIDLDLAGRPVSPTSTTYPDASFGWMDDRVQQGYQAAITTLSGGPSGRLVLSSQRLSGQVSSAASLQAAIVELEQVLGGHPRRRTEVCQARLTTLQQQGRELATALCKLRAEERTRWRTLDRACALLLQAHTAVEQQRSEMQAAAGTPAARRWARAVAVHAQAERRRARAQRALDQQVRRVQKLEEHWRTQQAAAAALTERLTTLAQVPRREVTLVPIIVRIDAGFSTEANLAWLIEMGYTIYTKVHNGQTTSRLRGGLGPAVVWERVGRNAEATRLPAQHLRGCPYPLAAMLVRYRLPNDLQHTTLLYYGDQPPPRELPVWFGQYNGRQVIEAGIKEGKDVFTLRRPLVRSPIGMQLQEQFARFAANFVRWAAQWARQQVAVATPALDRAFSEVKTLVRVVAHSRARLVQHGDGGMLIFDDRGPFAGAILRLWGAVIYQEVLPLFRHDHFTIDKPT